MGTVTDLIELADFLTARCDEDEQAAKSALRGDVIEWVVERLAGYDRLLEMYEYDDGTQDSDAIAFFGADQLADHIARHDPARVLREVEAKRLIIDEHPSRGRINVECKTCSGDHWGEDYPCPTLRLLALPYADHPDFRDAWKL